MPAGLEFPLESLAAVAAAMAESAITVPEQPVEKAETRYDDDAGPISATPPGE